MGLRAVLLDAFGTLLDAGGLHQEATGLIIEALGLRGFDPVLLHEEWDEEIVAIWTPDSGLSTWEVFSEGLKRCLAKHGVLLGPGELEEAIEILREIFMSKVKLYPGVNELISFCRSLDLRVGLVSNADSDLLRYLLSRTGLKDLLDAIIISDEVGLVKPDPRIFHLALRDLGVGCEDSLMVGDSRMDVEGARRAGLRVALVLRGSWPDLPGGLVPDIVVNDLRELKGPICSLARSDP